MVLIVDGNPEYVAQKKSFRRRNQIIIEQGQFQSFQYLTLSYESQKLQIAIHFIGFGYKDSPYFCYSKYYIEICSSIHPPSLNVFISIALNEKIILVYTRVKVG